jgi:hypothetical protein
MNRRGFLTAAALALPVARLGREARATTMDDLLDPAKLRIQGHFESAKVPDTLDLAERASFAVNNLTHNVDPKYSYYVYQGIDFGPRETGRRITPARSTLPART